MKRLYITCLKRYIFIKHSKTVGPIIGHNVMEFRSAEMKKVNLSNNLWLDQSCYKYNWQPCMSEMLYFLQNFIDFIHTFLWIDITDMTASYEMSLLGCFWEFSHKINDYSYLKYCIFTKHSHIVCLINVFYANKPDVTTSYGRFYDLIIHSFS